MSFNSWLRKVRNALTGSQGQRDPRRRRSPRPATRRPNLEPLEDRRLPAFLAPVDYAAGPAPMTFVSADFNNDGAADLAVLNFDNTLSLLLSDGDGAFQPPVSFGTPNPANRPVSLAVGDLDGDGKIDDLATANYGYGSGYPGYGGDVRVLLGNDDGTLQPARSVWGYPYSRPASVAVGDFNGDGKMDLAVSVNDYYYHSGGWLSSVNVLLGTGGGSFSAPKGTFVGRPLLNNALAADLNGDSYGDFVTLTPDYQSGQYLVVVMNGTSSGFLQGPWSFHSDSFGIDAGDIDGDGDNDLVTEYNGVELGDFTGDGNLDLITSSTLLYGRGDGTFSSPEPIGVWGGVAGDFDGDGWLDLAAFNQNGGVSVLINDRSWTGPPPSLTIGDAQVTEGHTGTVAAGFAVTLSSNPTEPVTVNYTTADWTATTADGDYQSASGTLTFNPGGPLTQTIPVLVNGDRRAEIGDSFFVNITSADAPVIDGTATGVIIDDEPTLYILSSPSVLEGNSGTTPLSFTVTLSAPYDVDITVDFATQDGSATSADGDYQATSGTATIAAGATTTTVTINVNGDQKLEPDETFRITLSNASSAYIPDSGQATGIIRDDELRVSISDVTKYEGKKGKATRFTFTVTLSAASNQPVTMSYRTVNGTATTGDNDYVAKTGTLTFAPGETVKTITIDVKGDSRREANETFYLDLFGLSSNAVFTKNRGIGTILNDD